MSEQINFPIADDGFIRDFLVSPLITTPYYSSLVEAAGCTDQLQYEAHLRQEIGQAMLSVSPREAEPLPFTYTTTGHDYFIDVSSFYSRLTRTSLWLKCILISDCQQKLSATLWTYQNAMIWQDGNLLLKAVDSKYKPIGQYPFTLDLKTGENHLLIYMTGLAVRDSRDIVGLQLNPGNLRLALSGINAAEIQRQKQLLFSIANDQDQFILPPGDKNGLFVQIAGEEIDLSAAGSIWQLPKPISGLPVDTAEFYWRDGSQILMHRKLEAISQIKPRHLFGNADTIYQLIAQKKTQPRATGIYFSVYHVLARYYTGTQTQEDLELLKNDLQLIDQRVDCSDFLMIGLLRLMKKYDLPEDLLTEIKRVFLNFRYFMDEEGQDGMCFFSENHSLMFYAVQMSIGQMYPTEIFIRSGRTGAEQAQIGAERCRHWLADVTVNGPEEFNSAGYLSVTLAALLHLIDFAPEDIAAEAKKLTDRLLRQAAMHVFDGSVISPQGRVYRDVLYPHRQTIQGLLALINPELAYSDKECMWNICFATSCYRFPQDLIPLMQSEISQTYFSGQAQIVLHKTSDYILTSVQSPSLAGHSPVPAQPEHEQVKLLNERFHGTSNFRPGVYGYQQHFWYAALSQEALLFVNHPSGGTDFTGMRPGYWYGNGIMPMTMQNQNRLGLIYHIPDSHPVAFTHIYLPKIKFDEVRQDGHWLFAFYQNGGLALWCSTLPVAFDDSLCGCEFRCYQRLTAYYLICQRVEPAERTLFMEKCKQEEILWQPQELSLSDGRSIHLHYQAYDDKTQYV
ncbi:hypothetical protein EII17_11385 [Clostridiales bacterium COT073_COT-073]|nr:hypothetical protein EII17_11385 [Clostridiales bacterium COT073_COT-073]